MQSQRIQTWKNFDFQEFNSAVELEPLGHRHGEVKVRTSSAWIEMWRHSTRTCSQAFLALKSQPHLWRCFQRSCFLRSNSVLVCFAIVASCNCSLMFQVSAYSLFDLRCRYAYVCFNKFDYLQGQTAAIHFLE